jgi:hypothetical protein
MTNMEVVQNLERDLIGSIKTMYDKLKLGEDDVIEFKTRFMTHITQYDGYSAPSKVPVVISGMMDNYVLAGVAEGSEVELPVDNLEGLYDLAHLADLIESETYTIKVL